MTDFSPSRTATPQNPSRTASPLPASKAIPKDFRSSLAAWWSSSVYKDARYAEERLLRRLAMFVPLSPEPVATGWFDWGGQTTPSTLAVETKLDAAQQEMGDARAGDAVVNAVPVTGTGLVATLRNVFVPTPNPNLAPAHPADPLESSPSPPGSAASSTSSLTKGEKKSLKSHHLGHKHNHEDYINTLEISTPENASSREAVVVMHGYAAALGFFFRNWESVATSAASTGRRTFFLDWLGMGLSSRPSPHLLHSPSSTPIPARVARAEHFFLDSLESWRESTGVDRMVLVGHSLGAYLASAYAVRYPHRVSGLILVSPAGIPHGPEYKRYAPSGEKNEGDREEAVDAVEQEVNGVEHQAKGEAKQWGKNPSLTRRSMMKFFVWGWERGLSPFSILRGIGPLGPLWVGKYSSRRFAAQSEEDVRDLHAYIYNTSIMRGSGEYCISHILAPGAYARIPIVDRIGQLKVPVTMLYGDNDWMDVDGGHASVKELNKAGNDKAKVHIVPTAGHHVYLDNPEETNRIIDEAIKAVPRDT